MVTVTKREAVRALIRGAMRACHEGDEVCALTLAGAAEEAMPRSDGVTAFEILKVVRAWLHRMTPKEAADALNLERNWLKHHSVGEVDPMEIDMSEVMLVRAITRYCSIYGLDDLTKEYNEFMGWTVLDMPPP